jgi:copper homeostasis protein
MPPILVEVCVDSVECALAAEAAGAGRVEVCADLVEGGTTPSAGTIALCCERLRIPVFVMIRPRGGDFVYSAAECEVMRRDVACAKRFGAAGVVFGVLGRDGAVDGERTRLLVEDARPLAVTFHRAFDVCREPLGSLEALIAAGVDRVLTSGQAATAEAGLPLIERLVRHGAGRIGVVAAGGVREGNVAAIVARSGVTEVHLRGATTRLSPVRFRNPEVEFGGQRAPPDAVRVVTDPDLVRRVVRIAGGGSSSTP